MNNPSTSLRPLPRTAEDGTHCTHPPLTDIGNSEPDADTPFPTSRLPSPVREFVEAVAVQERTSDSLPACCALGVLSASAGGGVCVLSDTNQRSFANLFILVGSESGVGKSRVFNRVAAPFEAKDRELHDVWKRTERPGLETDVEMAKISLKTLAGRVKKESDSGSLRTEMMEARKKLNAAMDALEKPSRLFTSDTTTQKLAILMQNDSESFASMSPDARDVVDNLLGRYHEKGSPDADFYIKAWPGDPVRVDRVGRPPVSLNKPCLAVFWAVQPDKITCLFSESAMVDSGFLPRFLTCQSNTKLVKKSEGIGRAVPPALTESWNALVDRMLTAFRLFRQPGESIFQPTVIVPTSEAKQSIDDYYDEIIEQRRRGDLTDVGGFAARWAEQAWRLAVILHVVEHGESGGKEKAADFFTDVDDRTGDLATYDPVADATAIAFRQRVEAAPLSATTAENAIKIVQWFVEQQLALLDGGRARQRDEQLMKLNALLDRNPAGVSARDLISGRVASDSTKANGLLEQYREAGQLEFIEAKPQGGGYSKRLYRRRVSTTGPADLAA